jgi:hypothetical protein
MTVRHVSILTFAVVLLNFYNAEAQWKIISGLSCPYNITIKTLTDSYNISVSDSGQGSWNQPIELTTDIKVKLTKDDEIEIKSANSNHRLCFRLEDYEWFLRCGGTVDNPYHQNNLYIFCCSKDATPSLPCRFVNACGALSIDAERQELYLLKPAAPYCFPEE